MFMPMTVMHPKYGAVQVTACCKAEAILLAAIEWNANAGDIWLRVRVSAAKEDIARMKAEAEGGLA